MEQGDAVGAVDAALAAVGGAERPIDALKAMPALRESLTQLEVMLARRALADGETWATIGAALGTSRQAAWERLRPGIAAAIDADRRRLTEERARASKKRRTKT
jgi:hypothetical protein